MFGFIYKTTNKVNGKAYIGMCSSQSRFSKYLGSGVLLKQAIEKYGVENYTNGEKISESLKNKNEKEKEIITNLLVNNDGIFVDYNREIT